MQNTYIKRMRKIGPMSVALSGDLLSRGLLEQGAKALRQEITTIQSQLNALEELLYEVEGEVAWMQAEDS
jgi:predicted  nucleic acid-binding Zn-ribbon protein